MKLKSRAVIPTVYNFSTFYYLRITFWKEAIFSVTSDIVSLQFHLYCSQAAQHRTLQMYVFKTIFTGATYEYCTWYIIGKDFFCDLAYKKLLPNTHRVLETATSQFVITNPTETDELEYVSGFWKDKLRTTANGLGLEKLKEDEKDDNYKEPWEE